MESDQSNQVLSERDAEESDAILVAAEECLERMEQKLEQAYLRGASHNLLKLYMALVEDANDRLSAAQDYVMRSCGLRRGEPPTASKEGDAEQQQQQQQQASPSASLGATGTTPAKNQPQATGASATSVPSSSSEPVLISPTTPLASTPLPFIPPPMLSPLVPSPVGLGIGMMNPLANTSWARQAVVPLSSSSMCVFHPPLRQIPQQIFPPGPLPYLSPSIAIRRELLNSISKLYSPPQASDNKNGLGAESGEEVPIGGVIKEMEELRFSDEHQATALIASTGAALNAEDHKTLFLHLSGAFAPHYRYFLQAETTNTDVWNSERLRVSRNTNSNSKTNSSSVANDAALAFYERLLRVLLTVNSPKRDVFLATMWQYYFEKHPMTKSIDGRWQVLGALRNVTLAAERDRGKAGVAKGAAMEKAVSLFLAQSREFHDLLVAAESTRDKEKYDLEALRNVDFKRWSRDCATRQLSSSPPPGDNTSSSSSTFSDFCKAKRLPDLLFLEGVSYICDMTNKKGELDVVLVDRADGEVLLVAEVKASPADLPKAREQRMRFEQTLASVSCRVQWEKGRVMRFEPQQQQQSREEGSTCNASTAPTNGNDSAAILCSLSSVEHSFAAFRSSPIRRWVYIVPRNPIDDVVPLFSKITHIAIRQLALSVVADLITNTSLGSGGSLHREVVRDVSTALSNHSKRKESQRGGGRSTGADAILDGADGALKAKVEAELMAHIPTLVSRIKTPACTHALAASWESECGRSSSRHMVDPRTMYEELEAHGATNNIIFVELSRPIKPTAQSPDVAGCATKARKRGRTDDSYETGAFFEDLSPRRDDEREADWLDRRSDDSKDGGEGAAAGGDNPKRQEKEKTKLEKLDAVSLPSIPPMFRDGNEYHRSFQEILDHEEKYQMVVLEERVRHGAAVEWTLDPAVPGAWLATFLYASGTKSFAPDFKLSIPDERRVGGTSFEAEGSTKFTTPSTKYGMDEITIAVYNAQKGLLPPPAVIPSGYTIESKFNPSVFRRMRLALNVAKKKVAQEELMQKSHHPLLGILLPLLAGSNAVSHLCEQLNPLEDKFDLPEDLTVPKSRPLNESQQHAIRTVFSQRLTLIQGPPGTGKTTTSTAIIYHYCKLAQQQKGSKVAVLVCAPSNAAADHLALSLDKVGLAVLRLLAPSRTPDPSSPLAQLTLDAVKTKLSKLFKGAKLDSLKYVFSKQDVVVTTCASAPRHQFPLVLVDEVTQSLEPECLIPITTASPGRVVLVGDQCQLGPVVCCQASEKAGLGRSIFERLLQVGICPIRLNVQYRMHPFLSRFSSQKFYDGDLHDGVSAEDRTSPEFNNDYWFDTDKPSFFFHCPGQERVGPKGHSYVNAAEALALEELVEHLLLNRGVPVDEIGIITPYEAQKYHIVRRFWQKDLPAVEVSSVDGFQGREKDYILFSAVRANPMQTTVRIGFVDCWRRLNVALTRARRGVFIIGNVPTLARHPLWNGLLEQYQQNGVLVRGEPYSQSSCLRPYTGELPSPCPTTKPVGPVSLSELQKFAKEFAEQTMFLHVFAPPVATVEQPEGEEAQQQAAPALAPAPVLAPAPAAVEEREGKTRVGALKPRDTKALREARRATRAAAKKEKTAQKSGIFSAIFDAFHAKWGSKTVGVDSNSTAVSSGTRTASQTHQLGKRARRRARRLAERAQMKAAKVQKQLVAATKQMGKKEVNSASGNGELQGGGILTSLAEAKAKWDKYSHDETDPVDDGRAAPANVPVVPIDHPRQQEEGDIATEEEAEMLDPSVMTMTTAGSDDRVCASGQPAAAKEEKREEKLPVLTVDVGNVDGDEDLLYEDIQPT